jgi:hypothetical protein
VEPGYSHSGYGQPYYGQGRQQVDQSNAYSSSSSYYAASGQASVAAQAPTSYYAPNAPEQYLRTNPVRQPEYAPNESPRIVRGGCVAQVASAPPPCSGEWIFMPYSQPAPQPLVLNNLPGSFFGGAMNYGVGYPTQIGYNSGGSYFVGGGSRFSGVRERSPTALVPPPMKHRSPPPPPVHKPPCGKCH